MSSGDRTRDALGLANTYDSRTAFTCCFPVVTRFPTHSDDLKWLWVSLEHGDIWWLS